MTLTENPFKNIVGKGENAGNVPQCFLPYQRQKSSLELLYYVVCKCFQFGRVVNFVVWKVCLGFFAISTVFQLLNGDSSQIMFPGLFLTST